MSRSHLLAAGALALLTFAAQAQAPPAEPEKAAVGRLRVLYLGLDGASVENLQPLIGEGEVPNLAKLVEAGTMVPLHSHEPTRSPAVWTTLATGTRKEKHGIYDYVMNSRYWPEDLRTNKRTLATSDMRKSPALWNLLGAAGKKSVVVGWLSTWPAEPIEGAMVAPYIDLSSERQTTIKGAIYKTGAPRQTHDPELLASFRDKLKTPKQFGAKYISKFFDPLPEGSELFDALPIFRRYGYTISWTGARMHNNTTSALHLAEQIDPDLVMVYYQCPDSVGHRFWLFRQPVKKIAARLEAMGVDPSWAAELKKRYGDTVDACYREVDRHIGLLQAGLGDGWSTVVASDHGFGDCERGCKNKNVPFDGGHRNDGILVLSGPAFAPGAKLTGPRVEDVPATILQAFGVALPADLDGKPLAGALLEPE